MSGRQTVRDADTGLQTCVHVGDLKELADRLRASDDSCMYFGCWDGPECDGCPADDSPYDCSGAMAHDAADRIDAAITRGVFAAGKQDGEVTDAVDELNEARFTLRHDALEAFEWVEEHGGLEVMRSELPVIAYRASLVGSVYEALEIDPDEPGAAMLLASEVKLLRDDHDAMLWIDERGGIDEVEAEWEYAHDRTGLANSVAVRLGVDPLTDADISEKVMGELDRRLMPEGMEWPRFEDGEPVRLGDGVDSVGGGYEVNSVTLYRDGSFSMNFHAYHKGERVKRPAPEDSWERIDSDIERGKTYTDEAVHEFVRRARALAERGQ